jgi:hypothetical protein
MSQFPGQGQFGNSKDIIEALKNKNPLTPKSMKARLLKEIQLSGISGPHKVGDIIDVRVPESGTKVYVRSASTGKEIELTIGKDVELIADNKNNDILSSDYKMTTRVRALRDLNLGGRGIVATMYKKGEIFFINENQPLGKTLYYKTLLHDSKVPLVLGQDIELVIGDDPQKAIVTKEQKGGLLFYGALAVLGYIVYRVLTTK